MGRKRRPAHIRLRPPLAQGHHSVDHVAKIKPAVLESLQQGGFRFTPDCPNPGCVMVHLGGPSQGTAAAAAAQPEPHRARL